MIFNYDPNGSRQFAVYLVTDAIREARRDPDARDWLLSPRGGLEWLALLDIDMPPDYENWVRCGCPDR